MIYEDILRDFKKQKVKYILVGGLAVNLHGALRHTADLDILVEMSDENLKKVIQTLKKKGYRVRQPVDPMGMAVKEIREDWIREKNMKAFNFYKDGELKEVDIIIRSPISYEKAKRGSVRVQAGDLTLPVMSINDLIRMKQKAGRAVDLLDVSELKIIRKLKKHK